MSRGGTSVEAGTIYHLISRFVGRQWFVKSDAERRTYLSLLGLAIRDSDWRCFSFAIMSNHIHLGLVAGADDLASWLRQMHSDFATWINTRFERIGAVFVRGPNVISIRDDGAARLISYIHNNPVRAGVVRTASDSDWTSHQAYLDAKRCPSWLDVERGVALAGFANGDELDAWMTATRTERADLEACHAKPRARRGRPRSAISTGISGAGTSVAGTSGAGTSGAGTSRVGTSGAGISGAVTSQQPQLRETRRAA